MTRFQYLMLKLMEESAEVQQLASKIALFGYNSCSPGEGVPNIVNIHNELNDLYAIIDELNENYSFNFKPDETKKHNKRNKMEYYRRLSENQT